VLQLQVEVVQSMKVIVTDLLQQLVEEGRMDEMLQIVESGSLSLKLSFTVDPTQQQHSTVITVH